MKTTKAQVPLVIGLGILCFIGFRVLENRQRLGHVGVGVLETRQRVECETRWAKEAQDAVEAYFRAESTAIDPTTLVDTPEIINGLPANMGDFIRLEGKGCLPPVWNIQGYYFLDLRRQAHFQHAVIPIRIIVTEGRVTAPGVKQVGKPTVKDRVVFVSHPEVRP